MWSPFIGNRLSGFQLIDLGANPNAELESALMRFLKPKCHPRSNCSRDSLDFIPTGLASREHSAMYLVPTQIFDSKSNCSLIERDREYVCQRTVATMQMYAHTPIPAGVDYPNRLNVPIIRWQ